MGRHRLFQARTAALATLVLLASACNAWHVEPGSNAAAVVANQHPSRVRLQMGSGERLELRRPMLERDSLSGLVGPDTVRVALNDVTSVAHRGFSAGRTGVRVGISLGLLFGLAALACAADPCGY